MGLLRKPPKTVRCRITLGETVHTTDASKGKELEWNATFHFQLMGFRDEEKLHISVSNRTMTGLHEIAGGDIFMSDLKLYANSTSPNMEWYKLLGDAELGLTVQSFESTEFKSTDIASTLPVGPKGFVAVKPPHWQWHDGLIEWGNLSPLRPVIMPIQEHLPEAIAVVVASYIPFRVTRVKRGGRVEDLIEFYLEP